MKRKIMLVLALCLLTCPIGPQPSSVVASKSDEQRAIGNIDFFGYGHFDVMKLRSVLQIKAGESNKQSEWSAYRSRIEEAIDWKQHGGSLQVMLLLPEGRWDVLVGLKKQGWTLW